MTRSFPGSEMAKGHKDKVAVITGAAGGIGQAFAKRLAEDGVHIAIVDVIDGKETVKLVQAAGRQALAVNCDVSSEPSVAAMAKAVTDKFSHVDIGINCAGIFPQKEFSEMTFADWRKVLAINLDGTFLVSAAFVPGMRARKWGRVVVAVGPSRAHRRGRRRSHSLGHAQSNAGAAGRPPAALGGAVRLRHSFHRDAAAEISRSLFSGDR